jgi:hypothetical protein
VKHSSSLKPTHHDHGLAGEPGGHVGVARVEPRALQHLVAEFQGLGIEPLQFVYRLRVEQGTCTGEWGVCGYMDVHDRVLKCVWGGDRRSVGGITCIV